jgi:hypothetical protein
MLRDMFTEHPASVGESYFEHMRAALGFSGRLAAAATACLVHAFLPFLFVRTGSTAIARLYETMVAHRARRATGVERSRGEATMAAVQGH